MSNSPSFIFLPDISGFTQFVNHTEIEHSRHLIKELLELLIDAEELDLSLAEIEGDALFFYSYRQVPSPERLFAQVQKMFTLFHTHLLKYEHRRICQCGACSSAGELSLKFIAHAGTLEFIEIKNHRKPFGKEVISAHRLMKNEVPSDEYLLLSEGLYNSWEGTWSSVSDMEAQQSSAVYDFGKVNYQYYFLADWKKGLPPPDTRFPGAKVKNPISQSIRIKSSAASLFEIVSNLEFRLSWSPGIDDLKFDREKVNRAGTEHLCIIDGKEILFETINPGQAGGKWEYGEKTIKQPIPFIKDITNYFTIDELGEEVLLKAEIHIRMPQLLTFIFNRFVKKEFEKNLQIGLERIKEMAEV